MLDRSDLHDLIIEALFDEMRVGTEKGGYNSRHEAWGVIEEEWEEFKDAVKADEPIGRCCAEAIQVAATSLRFVLEFAELAAEEWAGDGPVDPLWWRRGDIYGCPF